MKIIDQLSPIRSTRQKGVTLIEALVALTVMTAGTAAIFGIHSYVSGSSAQSRTQSALQSLAQQKIEELRQTEFNLIETGSDTVNLNIPMIGGNSSMTANRCWSVSQDLNNLLKVIVDASLATPDCTEANTAALITYIAEQDPRVAAQNVERRRRDDGDITITDLNPEDYPGGFPGNFNIKTNSEGKIVAIETPGGKLLSPKNGNTLKITELSGNIVFSTFYTNLNTSTLKNSLEIKIDRRDGLGGEFCHIFAPSENPHHLSYTCILPDQWAGAVTLITSENDQVCVGYPELTAALDTTPDILLSNKRFYFGQGTNGRDIGIQGRDDRSAVIGSVCNSVECKSSKMENWVVGGHHFYVKRKDDPKTCARSMTDLGAIKGNLILRGQNSILFRNPTQVHCINDKMFTNKLADISSTTTSTSCYSFTRVSGFTNLTDTSINPVNLGLTRIPEASCIRVGTATVSGSSEPVIESETKHGGYFCDFIDQDYDTTITDRSNLTTLKDRTLFLSSNTVKFIGSPDPDKLVIKPLTKPYDFTNQNINKRP